jgi:hypothetical protein
VHNPCCYSAQVAESSFHSQLETLRQQLAATHTTADQRLKEKAAADKEWSELLAGKEREARDRETKLQEELRAEQEKGG